jgi:hypothetical protein
MSVEGLPTFRWSISLPSSGSNKLSRIPAWKQVTSRAETSVDFQQAIEHYVPEDSTLYN